MPILKNAASSQVESAWSFLLLNWIMVGAMAAALGLSIALSEFSLALPGLALGLGFGGIYGGFALANARSAKRRDPQVMFVLGATAQMVLITMLMTPLTYVAAAADLPLQDAHLLAIDRALGFDWAGYVTFVNAHPMLAAWLTYGYTMIRWPIFAIPVFLAAKGQFSRIEEFTFAFGTALILVTIISALVPAIGVYHQIGLDPGTLKNINAGAYLEQLRDLPPARDGSLRHLDLMNLAGIVTFPSFHAASAVLYAWALWPIRWFRPVTVLANGAMLAATPINGGHYFIDLVAGIIIAITAIAVALRVGRLLERQRPGSMIAAPIAAAAAAD